MWPEKSWASLLVKQTDPCTTGASHPRLSIYKPGNRLMDLRLSRGSELTDFPSLLGEASSPVISVYFPLEGSRDLTKREDVSGTCTQGTGAECQASPHDLRVREKTSFSTCMTTMVPGQTSDWGWDQRSGGQTLETWLALTLTCLASALGLPLWPNQTLLEVGGGVVASVLLVPGIEPCTKWVLGKCLLN